MSFYKKALENGFEPVVFPRKYIILSGKIYTFTPVKTNEKIESENAIKLFLVKNGLPFIIYSSLVGTCEDSSLSFPTSIIS